MMEAKDYIPIGISILALAVSIYTVLEQARISRQQQFESTFFNLLISIRDLVNNTRGKIIKTTKRETLYDTYTSRINQVGPFEGLEYFREANLALQRRLWKALSQEILNNNPSTRPEQERLAFYKGIAVSSYDDFFDDHVSELAHYFRFIYNTVNLVDKNEFLTEDDKRKYINFIQAQMSADELTLMFFNGIGKYGLKFYELIEKYNLLENLDREGTGNAIDVFYKFYPKSKFRFTRIEEAENLLLAKASTYKHK
jgi:hypothetical protein